MTKGITIARYLIQKLLQHGVGHVFGIPGDYIIRFWTAMTHSDLKYIVTTKEDAAGFAADAYARLNGLGAVCVTYCVGGFNVTNPIAGAYAEKSPVVVISGAPGVKEREKNPLLHHKVRDFSTQKEIFEKITVASTLLNDPETACSEIDRVIDMALRYKRPVYIEIPRDMIDMPCHIHKETVLHLEKDNLDVLKEALGEARAMIQSAQRPVILAGVELHRFNLQNLLLELVEKTHIPVVATLLGKSVMSEVHPYYMGIYGGAMGREEVQEYVEASDCVIMLGEFMTDVNLGIYTARLDQGCTINANSEKIWIRHHCFEEISFEGFLKGLIQLSMLKKNIHFPKLELQKEIHFTPKNSPIRVQRIFEAVNSILDENMVVICDIGESLFGAIDLVIHRRTEFLSPAYYTSMGFAMPAALGAQTARPDLRPIVFVGDGAFQMTGMELSSILKCGLNPIVIVLNNHGYETERIIEEGPFNDIALWNFEKIPEVLGGGVGYKVKTEIEFMTALKDALKKDCYTILDVELSIGDHSEALDRLGKRLARKL